MNTSWNFFGLYLAINTPVHPFRTAVFVADLIQACDQQLGQIDLYLLQAVTLFSCQLGKILSFCL